MVPTCLERSRVQSPTLIWDKQNLTSWLSLDVGLQNIPWFFGNPSPGDLLCEDKTLPLWLLHWYQIMWWVLHALLFQVLCSLCDTLRTCFGKTLSGSKVLFDRVNRNEHRHLHVSLRWSGRLLATKRSRSLSITNDPSLSFVAKLREAHSASRRHL